MIQSLLPSREIAGGWSQSVAACMQMKEGEGEREREGERLGSLLEL